MRRTHRAHEVQKLPCLRPLLKHSTLTPLILQSTGRSTQHSRLRQSVSILLLQLSPHGAARGDQSISQRLQPVKRPKNSKNHLMTRTKRMEAYHEASTSDRRLSTATSGPARTPRLTGSGRWPRRTSRRWWTLMVTRWRVFGRLSTGRLHPQSHHE